MSRIGKHPVPLPDKVEAHLDGQTLTIKGPLGTLTQSFRSEMELKIEDNKIIVTPLQDTRLHRSLHGLTRTLIANMVTGVSQGFTKNLEMVGVGYRGQVQGQKVVLQLGYSHPVEIDVPQGIEVKIEANTKVAIKGADKQAVGDLAALIRSKRPPEPYKGKGVKYSNEVIRRKAGKAGK